MMMVNAVHPIALMEKVMAAMEQQGEGVVGILLGRNGRLGFPGLGLYSAMQSALWTWAKAARRGVQHKAIRISMVFPPPTPSALQGQLALKFAKAPKVKMPENADNLVDGVCAGKNRVAESRWSPVWPRCSHKHPLFLWFESASEPTHGFVPPRRIYGCNLAVWAIYLPPVEYDYNENS